MELLGVGSAAALAGCTGGGGGGAGGGTPGGDGGDGGDGGTSDYMQEAQKIKFGENWRDRRFASLDEWTIDQRKAIPEGDGLVAKDAWKESESLQTAPWEPPEGWQDTPAADVDSIQILNHGSLDFDLATVATFALFEARTGITIEPLEIVVDQAIPKKAAFFSASEPEPHGTDIVVLSSFSSFVQNGYLAPTRAQAKEEMWEPYIPMTRQSFTLDGEQYMGPNINQGGLVHTRPKLMRDQGVSGEVVDRITAGEWTWADLEAVGEAFKGTDTYAWAYRGASLVYTFRDWQKLFYQAGGSFVQDDGTVKINGPAAKVALEKMIEWLDEGYVPDAVTSYTQGDLADGFLAGEFVMVPVFGDLIKRAVDEYGKEPNYQPTLPMKGTDEAPNPSRTTIASPNGLAINARSSIGHKLALQLYHDCRYSIGPQWWEYVDEGNSAYLRQMFEQANETGAADFSAIRGESIANAKVETWQQQRATSQRLSQELQTAIAGDKEPQKALDDAQSFFNTVLGQDA